MSLCIITSLCTLAGLISQISMIISQLAANSIPDIELVRSYPQSFPHHPEALETYLIARSILVSSSKEFWVNNDSICTFWSWSGGGLDLAVQRGGSPHTHRFSLWPVGRLECSASQWALTTQLLAASTQELDGRGKMFASKNGGEREVKVK